MQICKLTKKFTRIWQYECFTCSNMQRILQYLNTIFVSKNEGMVRAKTWNPTLGQHKSSAVVTNANLGVKHKPCSGNLTNKKLWWEWKKESSEWRKDSGSWTEKFGNKITSTTNIYFRDWVSRTKRVAVQAKRILFQDGTYGGLCHELGKKESTNWSPCEDSTNLWSSVYTLPHVYEDDSLQHQTLEQRNKMETNYGYVTTNKPQNSITAVNIPKKLWTELHIN